MRVHSHRYHSKSFVRCVCGAARCVRLVQSETGGEHLDTHLRKICEKAHFRKRAKDSKEHLATRHCKVTTLLAPRENCLVRVLYYVPVIGKYSL